MLRTVRATQYVTALREGGSLPAIVAADDSGMYVLKFRGAGQGPLALVAELVAGEIGRRLGLRVPELVLMEVDTAFGRNEPDHEIRDLIRRSAGLNLAMDYLPGSITFDPAAGDSASPEVASLAVWFDAFVSNVDRTPRNANLLRWHKELYFIDHGAALYWHHNWPDAERKALSPFVEIKHHVLLPWASGLEAAEATAQQRLNTAVFTEILALVPDEWLISDSGEVTAAERRTAYIEILSSRLAASSNFVQEALGARVELV